MEIKRILTRHEGLCLNARFEDGRPVSLDAADFSDSALTGRVYVGRVQNIVQNIGAVFVEFERGRTAFLDRRQAPDVRIGDRFPIQITREAAGSKPPRCTVNISLCGRYCVLVAHSGTIAVSAKIRDGAVRKKLREAFLPYVTQEYGFLLRTNSADAPEDAIRSEMDCFRKAYSHILLGVHLAPFSLLYAPPAPYLTQIRDQDLEQDVEIITDQPDICEALSRAQNDWPGRARLRFYDDPMLSLYRLYRLEHFLEEAVAPRVWLKSGAYLVIERTEAMTVIDVNSGKAVSGKKEIEQTLLAVNLEAAAETARQLRLRNLSGIIVVDFIDLRKAEDEALLLERFREELRRDPVRTELVEMTKLKFASVVREKVRMPLADQLKIVKNRAQNG